MLEKAVVSPRDSHAHLATSLCLFFVAVSLVTLLFAPVAATEEKPASREDNTSEEQHDSKLRSHWAYVGIEGARTLGHVEPEVYDV